jgi:hypothetical protein
MHVSKRNQGCALENMWNMKICRNIRQNKINLVLKRYLEKFNVENT